MRKECVAAGSAMDRAQSPTPLCSCQQPCHLPTTCRPTLWCVPQALPAPALPPPLPPAWPAQRAPPLPVPLLPPPLTPQQAPPPRRPSQRVPPAAGRWPGPQAPPSRCWALPPGGAWAPEGGRSAWRWPGRPNSPLGREALPPPAPRPPPAPPWVPRPPQPCATTSTAATTGRPPCWEGGPASLCKRIPVADHKVSIENGNSITR